MRIRLEIDDSLMRDAMSVTGALSRKQAIEDGLRMLIRAHHQQELRKLRGCIAWDGHGEDSRQWPRQPAD